MRTNLHLRIIDKDPEILTQKLQSNKVGGVVVEKLIKSRYDGQNFLTNDILFKYS